MYLTHLSLTNFRNFYRLERAIPCGSVLLVGSNAQGKTSLLEAIYYLATFESFHATNDRQLINFLIKPDSEEKQSPQVVTHIDAEFMRPEPNSVRRKPHHLQVRLYLEGNDGKEHRGTNGAVRLRKEILLDGVKRKVGEALGHFNAVLFLPQMLRIVEGSPDERRRYLNLLISQVYPAYATILADYGQILSQRNALLKRLNEQCISPTAAAGELTYWDEKLAQEGTKVIHFRIRAVQELGQLASGIHCDLTGDKELLSLDYRPSFEPLPQNPDQMELPMKVIFDRAHLPPDKIQQKFLDSLQKLRVEEIARGTTTIGPQRDELRFLNYDTDLGIFGSRGQARTVVLALKLAEVAWMKDKTGQWPVLLLDEVLAELDPARRIDLLNRLAQVEQTLLTTTDLELFHHDFVTQAKSWYVVAGQVQEQPPAETSQ
jgi:DNA replication and repair protein RecF